MKTLIILLFLITLFWCCAVPVIIRAYAQNTADEIICGNRSAGEKRINTYISVLTWFNNLPTCRTKQDTHRINVLRDMLKEMQYPHG